MRYRMLILALTLAAGSSRSLPAQVPDWVRDILLAAQLPVVTAEARREGVPNSDVVAVLDALKNAGVPAFDATVVLDSARAARRDNGPVDNFGAFVQAQLASGKRGRDLAAAIRAEHVRQGKGKAGGARGRGQDDASPGPANAGNRGNAGRGNDARGRSGNARPPASDSNANAGNRGRGRPPVNQGGDR
jgi:hypothetical protein